MALDPILHPKLNWRAFRRDVLRAGGTLLGGILVLAASWFGMSLLLLHLCDGVRRDAARLDVANIQQALKLHHARTGRYPSTKEGLWALVVAQRLERLPSDPWGRPYHYELREDQPVVWSDGADGRPGGEGEDADVYSFQPPELICR